VQRHQKLLHKARCSFRLDKGQVIRRKFPLPELTLVKNIF
jgi:hypothetical protein